MNELLLFYVSLLLSSSGILVVLIHEAHQTEKNGHTPNQDMTLSEFSKQMIVSLKKTLISFRHGNIMNSGVLTGNDKITQPIHKLQTYVQAKLSPLMDLIMGRIKISHGTSSGFLRDISPKESANREDDRMEKRVVKSRNLKVRSE
tara:strand:- start:5833 stop:6270 length:438 start_codon:yes stop_codon:yes gene_type:complete